MTVGARLLLRGLLPALLAAPAAAGEVTIDVANPGSHDLPGPVAIRWTIGGAPAGPCRYRLEQPSAAADESSRDSNSLPLAGPSSVSSSWEAGAWQPTGAGSSAVALDELVREGLYRFVVECPGQPDGTSPSVATVWAMYWPTEFRSGPVEIDWLRIHNAADRAERFRALGAEYARLSGLERTRLTAAVARLGLATGPDALVAQVRGALAPSRSAIEALIRQDGELSSPVDPVPVLRLADLRTPMHDGAFDLARVMADPEGNRALAMCVVTSLAAEVYSAP